MSVPSGMAAAPGRPWWAACRAVRRHGLRFYSWRRSELLRLLRKRSRSGCDALARICAPRQAEPLTNSNEVVSRKRVTTKLLQSKKLLNSLSLRRFEPIRVLRHRLKSKEEQLDCNDVELQRG